MVDEQLEFRISQYVDGTLPPADRAALEGELATNAEAGRLLAEYRSLDALLVRAAPMPPELDWDRLASHISARVAEEGEAAEIPDESPARVIRLSHYWRRAGVAVAAVLAVAVGTVVWLQNRPVADVTVGPVVAQGETPTTADPQPSPAAQVDERPVLVQVDGPRVEPRPGPEVAVVSVGPAPTADLAARLGEGVVMMPSRLVWIASGPRAAHDTETAPF